MKGIIFSAALLLIALPAQAKESCLECHTAHAALSKGHESLTCTVCHHGDGKAADAAAAHAGTGVDELLKGKWVAASCARCHVPGAVAGTEELVLGARAYLQAGCQLCHKSARDFGSPAAFAPPLSSIGVRGSVYLTRVLRDPQSLFKGTVMPSYARELERTPALLTYLLSLRGEDERKPVVAARCGSCHGSEQKPKLEKHRCRLILDEAKTLGCARCHTRGVPESSAECLYIAQRRLDCGVCHGGGIDGR